MSHFKLQILGCDCHSKSVEPFCHFLGKTMNLSTALSNKVVFICGLKARHWKEVVPALNNMAEATKKLREGINAK